MSETASPTDRARAPRPLPKAGIMEIHAYQPGKAKADGVENPVKLSANENPLGSSPKAQEAYAEALAKLHIYPDPRSNIVREAIAEAYGLEPDRLIFGCGSDEVFAIVNQTFLEPGDNVVQGEHAFAAFAIGARACQAEIRSVPEPGYRVSVDELLKAVDERTRIVFLANPGNPTGTWIPFSEVERLHANLPPSVVLILDGAYGEFALDPGFDDGLELARRSSNIVVTHTFSKLHGLAGLRVGWGYGPKELVEACERIRLPFNVNVPAQLAAVAALKDTEFQERSIAHVERWRPWLAQQLGGLGFETVGPSAANFLLVGFPRQPGKTAADAEAFLTRRGLLVRLVGGYGLPDHLRITIGLEEHNRAVIDALAEFMRT